MVLTSMLMSMSILSLKLEFENVLMSMLIVNPGFYLRYAGIHVALFLALIFFSQRVISANKTITM